MSNQTLEIKMSPEARVDLENMMRKAARKLKRNPKVKRVLRKINHQS